MFVALLVCFNCMHQGQAQESEHIYNKGFSIGMNSDAFASLGPGYFQESSISGIPSYYYVKMRLPLLSSIKQKKLDSWEIEAGANFELVNRNKILLLTDFSLFTIRHKQSLGTFQPLGFNLKLHPPVVQKMDISGFRPCLSRCCLLTSGIRIMQRKASRK